MDGVYRTGPVPLAADYTKTLLQALTVDEEADGEVLAIGSVSKVQLLLTTLVERVHDAVYVLPRHARDKMNGETVSGPPPDAEEYARDVALALKALKKCAQDLPDDKAHVGYMYNDRIEQLKFENKQQLESAKEWEARIKHVLESRLG